ncbi:MAG: hypothetical protein HYX35_02280 [Proteobacteria bacterium]|nr:hypothetical protein [Pseudomonadota bacterium]
MKKISLSLFVLITMMSFTPVHSMDDSDWEVIADKKTVQIYPKNGAYEQNKGFSNLYGGVLPKAPVIQSYMPKDHSSILQTSSLFMHIPLAYASNLPSPIQEGFKEDNVGPNGIKIFVVGQTCPLKFDEYHHGFYPQYGTDPLAPQKGAYFAIRNPKIRVLYSDSQQVKLYYIDRKESPQTLEIKDEEKCAMSTVSSVQSVIHPECTGDHQKPCVHIGGCMQVISPQPVGLSGLSEVIGQSFWSVVSYNDGYSNQAIATLHLIFDEDQQQDFEDMIRVSLPSVENQTADLGTNKLIQLLGQAKELPGFKDRGGHFIKLLSMFNK